MIYLGYKLKFWYEELDKCYYGEFENKEISDEMLTSNSVTSLFFMFADIIEDFLEKNNIDLYEKFVENRNESEYLEKVAGWCWNNR